MALREFPWRNIERPGVDSFYNAMTFEYADRPTALLMLPKLLETKAFNSIGIAIASPEFRRARGMTMWYVKLLKDNAKAVLPMQRTLRRLKRAYRPYEPDWGNCGLAFSQGLEQIRLIRQTLGKTPDTVLELGTGWMPIVPLLFHLAGTRQLVLTDVERLMDDSTFAMARKLIATRLDAVARKLDIDEKLLRTRLDEPCNYSYFVPWNESDTAPLSVDAIVSRTVLEHIPPHVLDKLLDAFSRVLKPDGVMCHVVDNSDHWGHTDPSVNRVNFLRFKDGPVWRFMCLNTQNYQNRLRHSDYASLFRRAGWRIAHEEGEPDPSTLTALSKVPLAPPFNRYPANDIAILTSTFVLRPAAG